MECDRCGVSDRTATSFASAVLQDIGIVHEGEASHVVRRKGGGNYHPTPVDFLQRTRMLLSEGMFAMCGNANCEPDDDIILESTKIFPQTDEDCLELVIDKSASIMDCPEVQEN
ncbi:hypothetical protein AVEN_140706-1 [Araneus ventricosus]|uniref:Uncharacterized protein n=1 Tax=Araneus ventricosus TaxID=182803 RepID=A0A4Y2KE38_ARAVE|nr:hypothetical protein AVEN_140706-1 [Araneus ventricosus]